MRVVAVDWSGRKDAAEAEHIWAAEVAGGRLVELRNGRTRGQVVEYLVGLEDAHLLIGLDFSFSLPAWWMREQGYADVRALWRAGVDHGVPPFWGLAGSKRPGVELYRRTEKELRAKSTFQIAGAGAVGKGSIRGWPCLAPS